MLDQEREMFVEEYKLCWLDDHLNEPYPLTLTAVSELGVEKDMSEWLNITPHHMPSRWKY